MSVFALPFTLLVGAFDRPNLVYRVLARTPSYVLNTLGMTAMTFAIGGLGFWMPDYLKEYRQVEIFAGVAPVTLFGIITAQEGALPFYDLYFKELSLISARVAKGEDYPSAITLVERGTVRLEPLVSDVMPLVELKAAIAMLGSESGQRMKVIMEHG